MRIVPLNNRKIISITGKDALQYLQGLITVDIFTLTEKKALWSGILSPQGKVLFDFFLYEQPDASGVWIDIHREKVDGLIEHLKKFILRSDVHINLIEDYKVTAIWECDVPETNLFYITDPRIADMGFRMVCSEEEQKVFLEAHKDMIGYALDYKSLRVEYNIVDPSEDMKEMSFYWPEINAEAFNGIDYKKGCFVGQEVTARLKHKTELKKKIVPVFVMGCPDTPIEMATDLQDIGTLVCLDEDTGKGLAYVRVDRWENAVETLRSVMAGEAMVMRAG